MRFLLVLLALLSGNAFAQWGAIGNAYKGFQEGQDKELLRQCMETCNRGDGQCYQGCNSAYGPRPQQPQQNQYQYRSQAQQASFTGRQQYATSVTGNSIVQCEYEYNGTRFVRNFTSGNCPSSVGVQ